MLFSTIDFFFITDCIPNFARSLNVIQDVDNFSDHVPRVLEFDSELVNFCRKPNVITTSSTLPKKQVKLNHIFDWSRSDVQLYYEYTRINRAPLHEMLRTSNIEFLERTQPDIFTQCGLNNINIEILYLCCLMLQIIVLYIIIIVHFVNIGEIVRLTMPNESH